MVVAFALAGRININFDNEPIGFDKDKNPVFLKDIWPSRSEIHSVINKTITSNMFKEVYGRISKGNDRWNSLKVTPSLQY